MANLRPTLYIGVTTDLIDRVYKHKTGTYEGFTARYGLNKLVYFEVAESVEGAMLREKQLKKWNRTWKLRLITEDNPELNDLYPGLIEGQIDSRLRGNDVLNRDKADIEHDSYVIEGMLKAEV